jgi:hypothetical protein
MLSEIQKSVVKIAQLGEKVPCDEIEFVTQTIKQIGIVVHLSENAVVPQFIEEIETK